MSTTRGKRGPYAPSRKRREEIASAVLELIDESGHESLTTTQVAERSGISEATVLYHFPTKDHMLVAALQLADDLEAADTGVAAVVAGEAEPSPESLENLEALFASTTANDTGPRARLHQMLLGQAATPGHPAAEFFAQRDVRTIAIFTKLIRARQEAGRAHPGLDPQETATQFIAMWHGLGGMAFLQEDLEVNRLLLAGLRLLLGEQLMDARDQLLMLGR